MNFTQRKGVELSMTGGLKQLTRLAVGCTMAILGFALLHSTANAASIPTVQLSIGNGDIFVTGNGMTTGCIDFFNSGSLSTCQTGPGADGSFTVESGKAPFAAGQTGVIQDLNFSTPFPVVGFMTDAAAGPAIFDLISFIVSSTQKGTCALNDSTPNDVCELANSPFVLTNGPGGNTVSISLTANLEAYTGTSGTNYSLATPVLGIFTSEIAGGTIGSVLTAFNTAGFESNIPWSANLTGVVPEPGTFGLLGISLIGLGTALRRRFPKA
jgi:hypothetical protein